MPSLPQSVPCAVYGVLCRAVPPACAVHVEPRQRPGGCSRLKEAPLKPGRSARNRSRTTCTGERVC